MTIELQMQTSIINALKKNGCLVYKQSSPPAPIGTPDLLVIYAPGAHLWIEAKTTTGQLSPIQKMQIKKLRKRGETVFVCRSVTEAKATIEETRKDAQ
ncbi:MAG: VRR-NUC domain-containing protein [Cyanobacteria bacterium P01_D01_bin.36]